MYITILNHLPSYSYFRNSLTTVTFIVSIAVFEGEEK